MLGRPSKLTSLVGAAAFAAALAFGAVAGYAEGEPAPEPSTKGNNGYGQEKQGDTQDGENAGSDKGGGNPANGETKQDGTGLR